MLFRMLIVSTLVLMAPLRGEELGNTLLRPGSVLDTEGFMIREEEPPKHKEEAPVTPSRLPPIISVGSGYVEKIQVEAKEEPQLPVMPRYTDSRRTMSRYLSRGRQVSIMYPYGPQMYSRIGESIRNRVAVQYPDFTSWFSFRFFGAHHFSEPYALATIDWWRQPQWGELLYWLHWIPDYPITQSGYVISLSTQNWLPLGVFAVSKTMLGAPMTNLFVQLAVNRVGDIKGAYYNVVTNQVRSLDGVVDQASQEVVWGLFRNSNFPVMTSRIDYLVKDVAPVRVHFSNGQEESWVLVRLRR